MKLQTPNSKLVLVTGATGFIGWHVVRNLLAGGWSVRAFVRPESDVEHLRTLAAEPLGSLHFHVGRIEEERGLGAAARGVDAVVHLAAVLLGPDEESYRRVNVDGTMNLLDAVHRFSPGVRRFVFVSSVAASGPTLGPEPPDEDVVPHPVSFYGRTKLEAEATVLERSDVFPVTVLRPPLVYGPRDRRLLPYFALARAGAILLVDDGSMLFSLVHGADVASAVRAAVEIDHANQSVFFLADGPPRSMRQIGEAIRLAQDSPAVPVRVPSGLVRLASRAGRLALRRLGRVPALLHPDGLDHLVVPGWTCSADRIRRTLGWAPSVTLGTGLRETLEWYRRAGWLKGPWPEPVNRADSGASNGPRRDTRRREGDLPCGT